MPGSMVLSPINAKEKEVNNEDVGAAQKRKKSMIGRIKKSFSSKLGRRKSTASPTQDDLTKTEPKATSVDVGQQENEDQDEEKHASKGSTKDPESNVEEEQAEAETVLQFDAPLPVTKDDSHSEESEVKRGPTGHEVFTPRQVGNDDYSDDEEEDEAQNPGEQEPQNAEEGLSNKIVSDDEEETLEVFDHGEENQDAASHEPQEDDEDGHSPLDLMIVGTSLPTCIVDDKISRDEEECFDDAPETVVLPQPAGQPPSSPIKCVRPTGTMLGRVPANSPRLSFSPRSGFPLGQDQQPRPPLQGICEEDANEAHQASAAPRHFAGRRREITTPMNDDAPILSSAFKQSSPQFDEHETSPPTEAESEDGDVKNDPESVDAGALITRAFSERVVSLLGADPWGERQDGFDAIKLAVKIADVSTSDPVTRQRLLCASLAAVQCGVEDRVAPVMFCSLECLRAVLKEFSRVPPNENAFYDTDSASAAALNNHLSSLIGALARKLGDSNKRTQREATQALIRIARLRSLRALPHLLLHLSGKEVPARRQLETLRRLLQELGLTTAAEASSQQQQLTVETVLEFVAPSLKIAEEKTRHAAVELLADLQTRAGNSTAWHAQLACASGVKPEMLRVITRRVEESLAARDQQQQEAGASAPAGNGPTNQTEDQVDDEAAFPPAELVDVPQEDGSSSIALLETALSAAQNVVGPVCWRKLSSKTWSDRKEALLDVEKAMTEAKSDLRDTRPAFGGAAQSTFVAYSALLHRSLGDSIAPVVNTALDAYATLVKIFGPRIEWREADVRDVTLLTLLRLLSAMQKPNTRTTRAACRGVLKLARLPNARHPLRYVLSCIFGCEGNACDPQVQMHLLRLLVPEFGFQADGLGASRVLDAVSKGLTHNSARVRRSAADVALSAQRLLGREFVLVRLQGVKPVTLKELEKSFVDGIGGSGGGERPQTVHATVTETSAPAAIGDLPPVTFGGLGEFSSRRMLNSAPVGIGRLQCTPLYDEVSSSSPHGRGSVMSNEEESLMASILGDGDL